MDPWNTRYRPFYERDDAEGGQTFEEGDFSQEATPDPAAEERARLQRELDEARRSSQQYADLARTLADSYTSARSAPSRPEFRPEPEPDFDEMTPGQMAAYFEKRTEDRIKAALDEYSSSITEQYRRDREYDTRRWAMHEKQRTAEELRRAGLGELDDEVDRWFRENNISPEMQAAPGMRRRAATMILGERALDEKLSKASRAPSLSSTTYGGAAPVDDMSIKEEIAELRRLGIEVDEDTWKKDRTDDNPVLEVMNELRRIQGGR